MMSPAEIEALLARCFPEVPTGDMSVLRVTDRELDLLLRVKSYHLRPGGTVSGPTLMLIADTATWLALVARLGPEAAIASATSSLSIHFLRRPPHDDDLRAHARLLKVGRRLCVAEVAIFGAKAWENRAPDEAARALDPFAHATVTYSRPDG